MKVSNVSKVQSVHNDVSPAFEKLLARPQSSRVSHQNCKQAKGAYPAKDSGRFAL